MAGALGRLNLPHSRHIQSYAGSISAVFLNRGGSVSIVSAAGGLRGRRQRRELRRQRNLD